jgi:hypothetical protein
MLLPHRVFNIGDPRSDMKMQEKNSPKKMPVNVILFLI